jgi:hypothetical protein
LSASCGIGLTRLVPHGHTLDRVVEIKILRA